MSYLIDHAMAELARIDFGDDDSRVMIEIMEKFFDQWDSGGAVFAAAPVLMQLLAGKPLSPLTGADDEWYQPMDNIPTLQNIRCGTVFKEGDRVYNIDEPGRPQIIFPYWPDGAEITDLVIEFETDATGT